MFSQDFKNAVQIISIADSAGNDILLAETDKKTLKKVITLNSNLITNSEVLSIFDGYGSNMEEVINTLIQKNQIADFYLEGLVEFALEAKLPAEQFGLKSGATLRVILSVFGIDNDQYYHIHLFNKVHSEFRTGRFQIETKSH